MGVHDLLGDFLERGVISDVCQDSWPQIALKYTRHVAIEQGVSPLASKQENRACHILSDTWEFLCLPHRTG